MRKEKRRLSVGSRVVPAMMSVVLIASAAVFLRLRSGNSLDLTAWGNRIVSLNSGTTVAQSTETPAQEENGEKKEPESGQTAFSSVQVTESPVTGTLSLTVAGTLAIETKLRQSAYISDTKQYDFTPLAALLKPENRNELNAVFLENILSDDEKVSDTVVPTCAAELLTAAGFNVSLNGFSRAWDKKQTGLVSTLRALWKQNISTLGARTSEDEENLIQREINGIRVAMMQYSNTVSSSTRKSMAKAEVPWALPAANLEEIGADLEKAREGGAEVRIVFLNWGKVGAKNHTKAQAELAKQIAEAGADVIIGAGSRIPQTVEYFTTSDGRKVLCAYCLGTLMSDERGSVNRIGGYLLHLTFGHDKNNAVALQNVSYTPTYVWRYKQDDKYYYKCLAANRTAPDGMDEEQARVMRKTLEAVQTALADSPIVERSP